MKQDDEELKGRKNLLWAPWRIKYILEKKDEGCLFCGKSSPGDDAANFIIARGEYSFALLNVFPYNSGHLMIAPYRHTAELDNLPPEEVADLMALVRVAIKALKSSLAPEGFNIGLNLGKAAGAGVIDHLHIHIVPRWQGDTNFMPVIADTGVVPQSLEETCRVLRTAFSACK